MTPKRILRWSAAGVGMAMATYAAYVGATWSRYGSPARPKPGEDDELLDRFIPRYDVVERHRVRVAAPAAITLAAAKDLDLFEAPLVRAVFKGRELLLRAHTAQRLRARGMLAEVQALGWVVLAELPGQEIVLGAVTRPWQADVTFRPVPGDEFAAFDEPGYVKIAWTLRADPIDSLSSTFRTETRALATDTLARTRFRRYWAFLSPGIFLIRQAMLGPLKAAAERRVGDAA